MMILFYQSKNKSNVITIRTVRHGCCVIFFLTWVKPEQNMTDPFLPKIAFREFKFLYFLTLFQPRAEEGKEGFRTPLKLIYITQNLANLVSVNFTIFLKNYLTTFIQKNWKIAYHWSSGAKGQRLGFLKKMKALKYMTYYIVLESTVFLWFQKKA